MKFTASLKSPPIGSLSVLITLSKDLKVEWGEKSELIPEDGTIFNNSVSICRYLIRKYGHKTLYGSGPAEQCEVDHWLMFSNGPLSCSSNFNEFIKCIEHHLKLKYKINQHYLVGNHITIADLVIFESLFLSQGWQSALSEGSANGFQTVKQYYSELETEQCIDQVLTTLPGGMARPSKVKQQRKSPVKTSASKPQQPAAAQGTLESLRKEEGKFVELPGAEKGKVVVRFPPEASGYLHIGHAKAALLNQYYKEAFDGTLIMRFDDTNPAKEKIDFEKVILEDLKFLQIKPDKFTHTSDYFDLMLELCEKMIKTGNAYVDDSEPEVMKANREQKIASANRSNDVKKNLEMWNEMKKGSENGSKCCVRAKIDMESPNGCMRDPTIYRCKNEPHPRTGTKYKVYPTYDFACPIVDSIEGVTHCLRTMEYHDRDAQFYWFIDVLGLRKPYIWEYSRLNMTNTVLSKRKLTWFVENNHVNGWDDPRMPTVRGILRRGMTVEGLKQFVVAQGSSRSVVVMEWDKIWSFNKKVIDPVAARYTAVEEEKAVPVIVEGATEEAISAPKHPKNSDLGDKTVWTSAKVWIDQADAKVLVEGTNATFINWGNLKILKVTKKNDGDVTEVRCALNLSDKDYKKTMKLTWLADAEKAPMIPCYCSFFDHIISKPVLGKDEDFKAYIGHETKVDVKMLGDPELMNVKKWEIIQLQRKGFFICESPYRPKSLHSGMESPIILYHIPDGHSKEAPTGVKFQTKTAQTGTSEASEQINVADILNKITSQGDKVRDLKQKKASKADIDAEVKVLLKLKEDYKKITGTDWKPGTEAPKAPAAAAAPTNQVPVAELLTKISHQGDIIKKLKAEKAEKAKVEAEVKILLKLKEDYKKLTGNDWKPGVEPPKATSPRKAAPPSSNDDSVAEILNKISVQGDNIRKLKSEKAEKAKIDAEVKVLLKLKEDYKKLTGSDWKPGVQAPKASAAPSNEVSGPELLAKITEQGDNIRKLKSEKADKSKIDAEVKVLLKLKEDYKNLTGSDWKPGVQVPKASAAPSNEVLGSELSAKIAEQGDNVRILKSEKADKAKIDAEVKVLLKLKADFKILTGNEWKPGSEPPKAPAQPATQTSASELSAKVTQQGDYVRKLKADKADKAAIDKEVKVLLELKSQYKNLTGSDWKPGKEPPKTEPPKPAVKSGENKTDDLVSSITEQGDKVRNLKANKADKEQINEAVKILLSLKENYKKLTGEDYQADSNRSASNKKSKKSEPKEPKLIKSPSPKQAKAGGDSQMKKITRLGLEAKKEESLPEWYSQVITKGEMIEYYEVSGCYVLRPWSYAIWETIKDWFDAEIKKLGVKNCYFPLFVSKHVLEKEKTHIADFAPEVAWVTKSGSSDLAEPIAIRPTSETVMYPAYAKWIQSYRDLPIKLNQWNNVIRWEFKHPQPFLRTREFLWQEGHTAFATQAEAVEEVRIILDLYARIYSDLLAIPVVKGKKTEKEKFAGGDYTLTTEAFISASGRAIQGATSHHLGQNFSKMFDIIYEDPDTQEKKFVYQNSWGITTRTIGVLVMVHADNQGLVLPPKVASIQVVIVGCGITASLSDDEKEQLYKYCRELESSLNHAGVRVSADLRDNYSPGWKFNHWELKGVPLRIEVGPKDMAAGQVVVVRRDSGTKAILNKECTLVNNIKSLLDNIQASLYSKAQKELENHIKIVKDWNDFCTKLEEKNLLLAPFCGEIPCEDLIKKQSAREDAEVDAGAPAMGAKGLCIPDQQPTAITPSDKCIHPMCNNKPKFYTLFGRSY